MSQSQQFTRRDQAKQRHLIHHTLKNSHKSVSATLEYRCLSKKNTTTSNNYKQKTTMNDTTVSYFRKFYYFHFLTEQNPVYRRVSSHRLDKSACLPNELETARVCTDCNRTLLTSEGTRKHLNVSRYVAVWSVRVTWSLSVTVDKNPAGKACTASTKVKASGRFKDVLANWFSASLRFNKWLAEMNYTWLKD